MTLDAQTILFVFVVLQIGLLLFKKRARLWHYDSDKPYLWNQQRKQHTLNQRLLSLEQASDDKVRLYHFWFQVQRLNRESIPGAFAELGVYRGETAHWLHVMAPRRALHLFDTFTGFDARDLSHESTQRKEYQPGYFSDTQLTQVQKRLGNAANIHLHVGYFPESAQALPEQQYALVHLDADLYAPTLAALQYFYPRLSPGGVLIVHDYNHIWEGVPRAVNQFAQSIPEALIELPDRQGSVMIVRQNRFDESR